MKIEIIKTIAYRYGEVDRVCIIDSLTSVEVAKQVIDILNNNTELEDGKLIEYYLKIK